MNSSMTSRSPRLDTPVRAQIGEPFLLSITVRGHEDKTIPLTIYRGEKEMTTTEVTLVNGLGRVEFSDRLTRPGGYQYSATIKPEIDAHPGNNTAERWIEITGGPRLLLVTKYLDDPLATSLKQQGFNIETVTQPESLRVGQLAGARAVIFNNVPAFEVPTDFQDALDFFVREQGGGFLMAGGSQSFGSGGYFQSSIDPLLPISMELKNDHRKLSVALAIVMDRSGSMGMTVPAGGGKNLTKMDLANNGAAAAIDLLGAMDEVCIFAVDSTPDTIVPLTKLGGKKNATKDRALKVQAGGGGIFVYTGLKRAWAELKKSSIGTKHIILFTDAADSEEPGDYKKLLKEITDNNGTVSVIGLGSKADPDAKFIEDVAKLGNGRIFYTDKPMEIPRIFAQETVTIARSAFIKEITGTQPTGNWTEISPQPFDWLKNIDSYNLSYARPDATTSLVSTDEYLAPLVAHARRGLGRTMAVSFPLGGEHSEQIRQWPRYADFLQTTARWLMGQELPPGLGLRHRLEGTRLTLDLLYDDALWGQKLSDHPPRIKIIEHDSTLPYELAWKRISPGHFSLARDLEEGSAIRGVIQVGPHAIPFGPLLVGSSTEWSFDPERLAELRLTSERSGGRQLLNLGDAWLRPPLELKTNLRIPLLIALLSLILLEALITRTGWTMPLPSLGKRPAKTAKKKETIIQDLPTNQPQKVSKEKPTSKGDPTPPPKKQPKPQTSRSSRFDRAKKRK